MALNNLQLSRFISSSSQAQCSRSYIYCRSLFSLLIEAKWPPMHYRLIHYRHNNVLSHLLSIWYPGLHLPPPGLPFDQLSQSPPADLPGICNGSPLKRSCELLGALLFIAVVYFAGPQWNENKTTSNTSYSKLYPCTKNRSTGQSYLPIHTTIILLRDQVSKCQGMKTFVLW